MKNVGYKFKTAVRTTASFYPFYKEYVLKYRGAKRRIIKKSGDVARIMKTIFKTIMEHYLENEGGVYIGGLGYFCSMAVFEERNSKKWQKWGNTNGYRYRHLVIPDMVEPFYITLSEDAAKMKKRAMNDFGVRYKFLYREVKQKKMMYASRRLTVMRLYDKVDVGYLARKVKAKIERDGKVVNCRLCRSTAEADAELAAIEGRQPK